MMPMAIAISFAIWLHFPESELDGLKPSSFRLFI